MATRIKAGTIQKAKGRVKLLEGDHPASPALPAVLPRLSGVLGELVSDLAQSRFCARSIA